jgi:hypothetical protein
MKDIEKKNQGISVSAAPPGYEGPGFFATSLDKVVGLARKNSIWPLPFATSCCGIEFMATMASTYDFARFGSERLSFSPRQADLLMVMGTIAKKWGRYCDRSTNRWLSPDGCSPSVHARRVVVFSTHIPFYRESITSFLSTYMCRDVRQGRNRSFKV